jgi:hypothetical protein
MVGFQISWWFSTQGKWCQILWYYDIIPVRQGGGYNVSGLSTCIQALIQGWRMGARPLIWNKSLKLTEKCGNLESTIEIDCDLFNVKWGCPLFAWIHSGIVHIYCSRILVEASTNKCVQMTLLPTGIKSRSDFWALNWSDRSLSAIWALLKLLQSGTVLCPICMACNKALNSFTPFVYICMYLLD